MQNWLYTCCDAKLIIYLLCCKIDYIPAVLQNWLYLLCCKIDYIPAVMQNWLYLLCCKIDYIPALLQNWLYTCCDANLIIYLLCCKIDYIPAVLQNWLYTCCAAKTTATSGISTIVPSTFVRWNNPQIQSRKKTVDLIFI